MRAIMALLLVFFAVTGHAETFVRCPKTARSGGEFPVVVVRVVDGDTVDFKRSENGKAHRLRLAEIDAPEKDQPFGKDSRYILITLALNHAATIHYQTCDRYGRYVGHVVVNNVVINDVMIERGAAWFNSQYSNDSELYDAENVARDARRGLWALPEHQIIEPWVWRKLSAEERARLR